jgi:hypothetical protein
MVDSKSNRIFSLTKKNNFSENTLFASDEASLTVGISVDPVVNNSSASVDVVGAVVVVVLAAAAVAVVLYLIAICFN